jgi:hypothetical protein
MPAASAAATASPHSRTHVARSVDSPSTPASHTLTCPARKRTFADRRARRAWWELPLTVVVCLALIENTTRISTGTLGIVYGAFGWVLALGVLGLWFLLRMVCAWRCRAARQRGRWRWVLPPLMAGATLFLPFHPHAAEARFQLSESALRREATYLLSQPPGTAAGRYPRIVGLYWVDEVRIDTQRSRVIFIVPFESVVYSEYGWSFDASDGTWSPWFAS